MHLDHVGLQVHLSAKHNEFLVKASALPAWMVFLHKMGFLRGRLVDRSEEQLTTALPTPRNS